MRNTSTEHLLQNNILSLTFLAEQTTWLFYIWTKWFDFKHCSPILFPIAKIQKLNSTFFIIQQPHFWAE